MRTRLLARMLRWLSQRHLISYGMHQSGGDYLFVDPYGKVWLLKVTGRYELPLMISLVHRP